MQLVFCILKLQCDSRQYPPPSPCFILVMTTSYVLALFPPSHQSLVESQFNELQELAAQRMHRLEESRQLHIYNREVDEVEAWISEKEVIATLEDYGKDLEHVVVSQSKSSYHKSVQLLSSSARQNSIITSRGGGSSKEQTCRRNSVIAIAAWCVTSFPVVEPFWSLLYAILEYCFLKIPRIALSLPLLGALPLHPAVDNPWAPMLPSFLLKPCIHVCFHVLKQHSCCKRSTRTSARSWRQVRSE